jgi:hypothetical protein
MADKKISALTAATTPLAGTEVLPIVQGASTVKVSVADLTAGRSFNALGMTLTSTDAGATAAPLLDLYRDSASPAATDTLGEIEFNGEDSAGNKQTYGVIHGSILSPTSTAEQGQLHFETATAGALTEKMIIGTTNLVINEPGSIFNVRIEGDTDANLFYTDATNSRVGVGTISPSEKLDVVGNIKLSDNLIIGTTAKGITTGSAIPLGFGVNNTVTAMTIDVSSNVGIGTTTPTTGSISNKTILNAGVFATLRGSVATSNLVPITIATIPNFAMAVYMVSCGISSGAPTAFTAIALVSADNSVLRLTSLQTASLMTITVSGTDIQATQGSGGAAAIIFSLTRIA